MRRSRAPSKLGKGKTPPLVGAAKNDSRGAAAAIGSAPRPLGERNRNGGVGTPPSPPFAAAPARPTAASVVAEARRPSATACTAGEQRLVEGALGGPLSLRDDVDPEAYRRSTAPVVAPAEHDRSDVMEEPSEPELGAEVANGSPEPIAQLPEPGTEAGGCQGAAEGGAAAMEEEIEEEEEDRLDMSALPPLAAELLVGTWCAIGRITINDTTTRLEEKFVLRAEGGGVAGGSCPAADDVFQMLDVTAVPYTGPREDIALRVSFVQAYPDGARTVWRAEVTRGGNNVMRAGTWAGACNGTFLAAREDEDERPEPPQQPQGEEQEYGGAEVEMKADSAVEGEERQAEPTPMACDDSGSSDGGAEDGGPQAGAVLGGAAAAPADGLADKAAPADRQPPEPPQQSPQAQPQPQPQAQPQPPQPPQAQQPPAPADPQAAAKEAKRQQRLKKQAEMRAQFRMRQEAQAQGRQASEASSSRPAPSYAPAWRHPPAQPQPQPAPIERPPAQPAAAGTGAGATAAAEGGRKRAGGPLASGTTAKRRTADSTEPRRETEACSHHATPAAAAAAAAAEALPPLPDVPAEALELVSKLNASQQRAALSPIDAPLLILAGPGSGKTATLTNRILYCLSQGVEPSQILAVSFTNAAAAEMGSRLKKMLKEARKKGKLSFYTRAITSVNPCKPCTRVLTACTLLGARLGPDARTARGGGGGQLNEDGQQPAAGSAAAERCRRDEHLPLRRAEDCPRARRAARADG